MPTVLSDLNVCDSSVPQSWLPVLEQLSRFLDLEHQLRNAALTSEQAIEIQVLHDGLLESSRQLWEPHALDDVSESEIHGCFAKAIFALMQTARAVVGEDPILDTTNCKTLGLYEPDYVGDPEREQKLVSSLKRTVKLDDAEIETIREDVEKELSQAERKHKVIRAIRDHFGLWATERSDSLQQNIFRFFEAMYPDAGLVAEEVELVVTGSMIFFCLPFREYELTTQRFHELPPQEQVVVSDFLKRINRFHQWQFAHFPVFGFRRGRDLNAGLLKELASQVNLSVAELEREISTLCAIIPLADVDKYVVHDIWGHSWQACLLSFDHHYQTLSRYAAKLDLNEEANVLGESSQFADCFDLNGEKVTCDTEKFKAFVDMEVAERLPTAMVPVLAELLADVAEFKLVATKKINQLEGSSHFGEMPAKLDLTMQDVEFYFRQATKVFRLWASRDDRRARTIDQLVTRGGDRESAERAVETAVSAWCDLENEWMASTPIHRVEDERVYVNVSARLHLNFLAIHAATIDTYQRVGELDTRALPIKGFRDLLILCAAVFLETSPSRNLWRVDEFLATKIIPLCVRLAEG